MRFARSCKARAWGFICLCMSLTWFACEGEIKHEESEMPQHDSNLQEITRVMEAHTAELMALPGVVGVYIGAREDSTLCIRVMVVEKTEVLAREIPTMLEGKPVEIEVTGVIRPLGEQ